MAQLLQHNQEHYVPCSTKANSKITLEKIPLHGDQLFEMSFGLTEIELMNTKEGIDTEFVDSHANYTLYKVKERGSLH